MEDLTTIMMTRAKNIQQLLEYYKYSDLKDRKIPLEDHERKEAMDRGAHWSDGTIGIWKARTKTGKTVFGCNTHRAMQVKDTLKGAIGAFSFIRSTS